MVVKTQCKGREITGVEVGIGNVRRYFSKEIAAVELLLDHLLIQCDLAADFWQGDTQIRDRRLCAWLESKNFNARPGADPIALAMMPSGQNCFRLKPLAQIGKTKTKPTPEPVNPA
jgi:hypothetical protein